MRYLMDCDLLNPDVTKSSATGDTSPVDLLQQPVSWISRRWRACVWTCVGLVLAVYAAGVTAEWYVGHDSGLYLSLARNLARGQGYTIAGAPSAYVPPAFPVMLAGLMRAGMDSFLVMNLAMCAMGLATVAVGFLLLRQIVHRDWALILTAIFALSAEMTQRSGEILSDVPFMLLVMTAIWLYVRGLRTDRPGRGGWEIASLLLVAACWFRMAGFPLAGGAAIGLIIAGWRQARGRAIINAAIIAIGLLITLSIFNDAYQAAAKIGAVAYSGIVNRPSNGLADKYLLKPIMHLYETTGQLSRLFFVQHMPLALCVAIFLPILPAMFRRIRRRDAVGPLIILCYVGGLSVFLTMLITRYLLPLMPLLLVYMLEGYLIVIGYCVTKFSPAGAGRKCPPWMLAVPLGLVILLAGMNLPLAIRLIVQKHRPEFAATLEQGRWRDEYKAAMFLRDRPVSGLLLADFPVGYLADKPCIFLSSSLRSQSLSDKQIGDLLAGKGVGVVVLDHKDFKTVLDRAMFEYLGRDGRILFSSGELRVFEFMRPGTQGASTQGHE